MTLDEGLRSRIAAAAAVVLPIFALAEINYPHLAPQSQLAIFAALGLVICFLGTRRKLGEHSPLAAAADVVLAVLAVGVCAWVVVQTEPLFEASWLLGSSLGDRAGAETGLDVLVGAVGLIVVLEATRRTIGWVLPALAGAFLLYAYFGASLPSWLLPHRGYGAERIVAQTFLQSQGVFGIALRVMFTYVFLFVLFGALLEATGATGFIVEAARRLFRKSTGGAAKVSVLSSGLMGSLSGSAVANTATTGTFTIPMMRSSGFPRHVAGGVEAAASSGGALVPPVMGAGAYMMLEIVTPPVTYLEIIQAAFLPALVYYFSIFAVVHLTARRFSAFGLDGEPEETEEARPDSSAPSLPKASMFRFEGLVFISALGGLILFLLLGFSVFRAVSLALAMVLLVSSFHRATRLNAKQLLLAVLKAGRDSVPLVSAAACVGVVIGVVTLTGIGTRLPALILPLAQDHLLLALGAIMLSSIVLGMGLPSAVCYLLLATLIGPVLGKLGVVPLAAHLFIFYFGMMSMVTPPVALAAYAASSISGSSFLKTSWSAFRFALVGFVLPYIFVLRPALLMLAPDGSRAPLGDTIAALAIALLGVLPLAAAITGRLFTELKAAERIGLFAVAVFTLLPGGAGTMGWSFAWWNLAAVALYVAALAWDRRRLKRGLGLRATT
ncbi:MAG: TRAP transporter fused permease subunit [bacterium]|nr:TRAP transporter fused permease subunit [bacterium]